MKHYIKFEKVRNKTHADAAGGHRRDLRVARDEVE
jgi:hypothetical protein